MPDAGTAKAPPPPLPPTQRRRVPRVELEVEVDVADQHNFYVGFSENISEGGLFIATYNLREVGTEIELKFGLPDGYQIAVKGIVCWVRDPRDNQDRDTPPGMGIQFQELDELDRDAIRAFIEIKPPLFYPD